MANSNEDQKESKQLKQAAKTVEKKSEQNGSSSHKNNFLLPGLSLLVAISAIGIALYTLNFNKNVQNKLLDDNKSLSAELEQLKEKQTTIQDQIVVKTDNLEQSQSALQKKVNHLNKALQTAMTQQLYQNQDWLLLKARYYLELAQINTHWSDNFNATIALLQEADQLLSKIATPQIFDIRQTIAKEIAELKATSTTDIAGLLSQLDAAQITVSKLKIQSTFDEPKPSEDTKTQTNINPSAWHTRLQESTHLLEKLVIVRRADENYKPLISPLFESILRESIRLNLQEAQWAVLNNNPTVYQLALNQAAMNIKRTFDETSTRDLLKQIAQLQQIKLTQEKPLAGQALPLLNQLIDKKELPGNKSKDTGANIQ